MISALVYLQYHTFRNRLVTRIRRLQKPKYLVGAIVGGFYFYFYFFRYLVTRVSLGPGMSLPAGMGPLLELLGALVLFVIVLVTWIVPHERAALTFTEAEVAFLFPAPITRRNLIHFKLVRSQVRIFFSVILLTLFSRRFGGNVLTHALGWWLILSTLNLHFLGSSFTRTLLLDRGISNGRRRLVALGLVAALVAGIGFEAQRNLPALAAGDFDNFGALTDYVQRLLTTGPALYVLFPFRLVVRPFLAQNGVAFLAAAAPALLLFLLHYLWVIHSDVAFEEASVEASQKLATRLAAARSGQWPAAQKRRKARRPWFKLSPTGPRAVALGWKNLLGTGQFFSPRLWIILAVVIVAAGSGFTHAGHRETVPMVVEIIIAAALIYSLILGPQLLRQDFRTDLPHADVLKSFPLRGWQMALGEILAPLFLLVLFQWLLLLLGTGFVVYLPPGQRLLPLAVAASATMVLPALDALLLVIPNAAVLLFPSWISTGKDSPRGIEMTGQRLIFVLGQMLALVLALAPAAGAFAIVFFPAKFAIGYLAAIPFGALAAAAALAAEAMLGILLLGWLFERFDVADEPIT